MKIIHILGHSLMGKLPPVDNVHKADTVSRRYALKTRQYAGEYEVECWWPERQISYPITAVEDGVTFRSFPASSYRFPYKYISLSLARALRREARKNQILVFLHGFGGRWTTLLPLLIKGAPFITQQHCEGEEGGGVPNNWRKLIRRPWLLPLLALERRSYKHIDHFFLLYPKAKEEMEKYVGPDRISLQPLGVDFDRFKPMPKAVAREALGLKPSGHYLLYVGRVERKKGINYLFEALPAILRSFPETVLLAIGRAHRQEFLNRQKEMLIRLGVQDKVRFLGEVKNDELPVFYNAADLLVLPTLTEGFGLVLAEAAACECPFVATQVGGIPEFFKNVPHGRLVPPANSGAIAEAVTDILKEPSQFKGSREKARMYSWDFIIESTLEVFKDLRQKYFPG